MEMNSSATTTKQEPTDNHEEKKDSKEITKTEDPPHPIIVDEDTIAVKVPKNHGKRKKKKSKRTSAAKSSESGETETQKDSAHDTSDQKRTETQSKPTHRKRSSSESNSDGRYDSDGKYSFSDSAEEDDDDGFEFSVNSPKEPRRASDPLPNNSPPSSSIQHKQPTTSKDDTSSPPSSPSTKRPSLLSEKEFNDNFILDVILAMRTCVLGNKSTPEKIDTLSDEDFRLTVTYKISRTGDQRRFPVKDFAPVPFYGLRTLSNISNEDYLESWSNPNISQQKSSGKSDSIFIYSTDKRFLLKTITKSESKYLRHIMSSFYEHMMAHSDSLLLRFFGHHRISRRGKKIYFVVMSNVFDTPKQIHEIYDLKGSKVGREGNATTATESDKESSVVLKDNDFLARKKTIVLSPQIHRALLDQLAIDCEWLEKHNRMDYSLLVGIHHVPKDKPSEDGKRKAKRRPEFNSLKNVPSHVYFLEGKQEQVIRRSTLLVTRAPDLKKAQKSILKTSSGSSSSSSSSSTPPTLKRTNSVNYSMWQLGVRSPKLPGRKEEVYFLAIIDFLQDYNGAKKLAHFAKSLRYNKNELSTVDPAFYSKRFQKFISNAIEVASPDDATPTKNSNSKDDKKQLRIVEDAPHTNSNNDSTQQQEEQEEATPNGDSNHEPATQQSSNEPSKSTTEPSTTEAPPSTTTDPSSTAESSTTCNTESTSATETTTTTTDKSETSTPSTTAATCTPSTTASSTTTSHKRKKKKRIERGDSPESNGRTAAES